MDQIEYERGFLFLPDWITFQSEDGEMKKESEARRTKREAGNQK